MSNLDFAQDFSQNFRLLFAETVCLDTEHFAFANQISSLEAANAWQVYLNTLALLALETWLDDRLTLGGATKRLIERDMSKIAVAGSLKLRDYKFCAISTEHLLNEVVNIPQGLIEESELTPHFYVLLEVLEEEEEVIIRGFLPHNKLIQVKNDLQLPVDNDCYQIPLSYFDIEPNHLLTYYRHIQASEFTVAIAAPIVDSHQISQVDQISVGTAKHLSSTTTLSEWLQGLIDQVWQNIDSFANPELNLAFSTRNINRDTKRAKTIDLGSNFNSKKVALLVHVYPDTTTNISEDTQANITPDSCDKINVLAQLHPVDGERFLPQNTKLILLSKAGKILQEVTARLQDNYIQLKVFKGEPGKKFSIQVSLEDFFVTEDFEL